MKKRLLIFGVAAIMAITSCFAFSACSGNKAEKTDSKKVASDSKAVENKTEDAKTEEVKPEGNAETAPKADGNADVQQSQTAASANEETKYGNAEVYTNDNGKPAAKTESGVEVELSGENMNKLLEDYQKVQGSGSEEERAVLDQIQVILEATQGQNVEIE